MDKENSPFNSQYIPDEQLVDVQTLPELHIAEEPNPSLVFDDESTTPTVYRVDDEPNPVTDSGIPNPTTAYNTEDEEGERTTVLLPNLDENRKVAEIEHGIRHSLPGDYIPGEHHSRVILGYARSLLYDFSAEKPPFVLPFSPFVRVTADIFWDPEKMFEYFKRVVYESRLGVLSCPEERYRHTTTYDYLRELTDKFFQYYVENRESMTSPCGNILRVPVGYRVSTDDKIDMVTFRDVVINSSSKKPACDGEFFLSNTLCLEDVNRVKELPKYSKPELFVQGNGEINIVTMDPTIQPLTVDITSSGNTSFKSFFVPSSPYVKPISPEDSLSVIIEKLALIGSKEPTDDEIKASASVLFSIFTLWRHLFYREHIAERGCPQWVYPIGEYWDENLGAKSTLYEVVEVKNFNREEFLNDYFLTYDEFCEELWDGNYNDDVTQEDSLRDFDSMFGHPNNYVAVSDVESDVIMWRDDTSNNEVLTSLSLPSRQEVNFRNCQPIDPNMKPIEACVLVSSEKSLTYTESFTVYPRRLRGDISSGGFSYTLLFLISNSELSELEAQALQDYIDAGFSMCLPWLAYDMSEIPGFPPTSKNFCYAVQTLTRVADVYNRVRKISLSTMCVNQAIKSVCNLS